MITKYKSTLTLAIQIFPQKFDTVTNDHSIIQDIVRKIFSLLVMDYGERKDQIKKSVSGHDMRIHIVFPRCDGKVGVVPRGSHVVPLLR